MRFDAYSISADLVQRDKLLNRLDGLPLAIAQAAAFLKESGMKFEDYIEYYDRTFRDLMDDGLDNKPLEYHGSVWTTWTISFEKIKSKNDTDNRSQPAHSLVLSRQQEYPVRAIFRGEIRIRRYFTVLDKRYCGQQAAEFQPGNTAPPPLLNGRRGRRVGELQYASSRP